MRKTVVLNIAGLICSLISFSCKEDFNPIGELKDKYILTCILRGDTTAQVAYISGSYKVDGYDPYSNTDDPNIQRADVRVWYMDSVFVFNDDKLTGAGEVPAHTTPGSFYTNTRFRPLPNKTVEIEAVLPNGRRLKASTKMPALVQVDWASTDSLVPMPGRNYVVASWMKTEDYMFYVPRLSLIYFKNVNGSQQRFVKSIPAEYVKKSGVETPVYPPVSFQPSVVYEMDAINRAMREISEGDPKKENYSILTIMVDVLTLDKNVSAYYSSGQIQSDGFTVKVDQTDFTNISGGLGIFGAYTKKSFPIKIDKDYIRSFGYMPGLK